MADIEWGKDHCYVKCSGVLSAEWVKAMTYAFVLDDKYPEMKYLMFDMYDAHPSDITDMDILGYAVADSVVAEMNPSLKLALIAKDKIILAQANKFAERYATFKHTWNVRIFTSRDEALEWCKKESD